MNIKKQLKKIKVLKHINYNIKIGREFDKDKRFFETNYIDEYNTIDKIEYALILEIHKLEKGMACRNMRPFGIDKIKMIVMLLEKHLKITKEKTFAFNLAFSSLQEYKKVYESHNWNDKKEYNIVSDFLSQNIEYDYIPVGAFDLKYNDIKNDLNIDYEKFIKCRHSIRNFANKELSSEDIKKAVEIAILSPSACNRQMCKIYHTNKFENSKIVQEKAQGLGLFELDNINYFVVTFDVSANYFIGERNQGWFNAGLFSMNFINGLHSLGIGSCCIQFGNTFKEEEEIKKQLEIPKSERIAVIIVAGYYDEVSRIPYSTRKDIKDIYFER